jgi:hypothetical protein
MAPIDSQVKRCVATLAKKEWRRRDGIRHNKRKREV